MDFFIKIDFDIASSSPGWFVVYKFPRYSKIAFGPSSLLASSKAFLKLVLYFGNPEDFERLNTDVPSFFICFLRFATSDFLISV